MTDQSVVPLHGLTDEELVRHVGNLSDVADLARELAKRLADVVDADLPNQVEELTDKLHDARIDADDRAETITERDLKDRLRAVRLELDEAQRIIRG